MQRSRTRVVAMSVFVAMLVAAGCGGGGGAVTAPNTPKQLALDKALAKDALLRLNDLPAGYKGTPHVNSDDPLPPGVEKTFLACTHLPKRFIDDKSNKQPNADAPDFSKGRIGSGPATEVDSSIDIERSSDDIKEPLSHLGGTAAAKCFEPFFKAAFEQALGDDPQVTMGPVSVVALDPGSIGDQTAAFQGRVKITGSGGSLDIEFNLYFVRTGRAIAELTAIGFDTSFDQTLAESLLSTMVDRLKDAT